MSRDLLGLPVAPWLGRRLTPLLLVASLASGCAVVKPARIALPDGLAQRTELLRIDGVGGGTHGRLNVDGRELTFTRSASRLSLFDGLYSDGRSALDFSLGDQRVSCNMRQRDSQIGVINLSLKPWALHCELPQSVLKLVEASEDMRTLQRERAGELVQQESSQRWTVRSVHRLEGTSLPVAEPIGYVIEAQGQAIAAIEANGGTLRLFLPRDNAARREMSLQVLLALGLLWSPE